MNLPISFEDDNVVAFNKPAGLVVHPFDYSSEETLLDYLKEKYPQTFDISNEKKLQDGRIINLGGLVHKLDRDTSGIILVAKNQKTFDSLKSFFKERQIKKTYIALVEGIINDNEFVINAPLGREKKNYRQVANPTNLRGELREAITNVKVLGNKNGNTLVELNPITGRTHQLRAHMKYIKHPIIGDKIYGTIIDNQRLMLHAQKIEFILNDKKYLIETEIPKEFNI